MPDLRKDPIIDRWVIIAQNRARRPLDFETIPRSLAGHFCPFCAGHEDNTPSEILAYRDPAMQRDQPGWRVRVFPNKFPALEIEGELNPHGEGIYDRMCGVGAHEVIVETPQHVVSTSDLAEEQLREVLWVYRDRLIDLQQDPRLAYGMIFKNVGAAAGASLEHTHSQLIATPIVPINVKEEMAGSLEFYNHRGRCVYCDIIQQELATEKRMVLDMPNFAAFCPFASRFPFETWIVPKKHASHYESIPTNEVDGLASAMKQVIAKIESALDRPAYNYLIHTAPFGTQSLPHYHWHLEIIPSLAKLAGFEWGTGFYINPVSPEDAATFLRETESE